MAAVILCLLTVALQLPGRMNHDALNQVQQIAAGRFDDWHPPIMAISWAWLLKVMPFGVGSPMPPVILQLVGQWFGLWLIAAVLYGMGRTKSAWMVLACGLSPLLLRYGSGPWSDVQLVASMLVAFGLALWVNVRKPAYRGVWIGVALVFLAYAVLVRANAVFAYGAVMLYLLFPAMPVRKALVVAVVLALMAIPASMLVNKQVFRAVPSGVERSLQLFDITGTAHNSGDYSLIQRLTPHSDTYIDTCFTSYYWDRFSYWGACKAVWQDVAQAQEAQPGVVSRAWIGSILQHPFAYLAHRLKYFNSMMYFLVPADHFRFAFSNNGTALPTPESMLITREEILKDLGTRLPFLPMVWFVLDLGLLVMVARGRVRSELAGAAGALSLSGVLYTLAFLPFGVATDMRYHLWLETSGLIALIVLAPQLRRLIRRPDLSTVLWLLLMATCLGAAAVFRLLDCTEFLS